MSHETHVHQAPERSAIDTRGVLWAACGALLLLLGAIAGLDMVYRYQVPIRTMPGPQAFPEPRLRVDERVQRQQLLAAQRRRLNEYRWIDEGHQLAQIPIDRAMGIIAREGAQAYAPLVASSPALSSPAAGAECTMTPGDGSRPAPAAPATTGERPASQPKAGRTRSPQEDRP